MGECDLFFKWVRVGVGVCELFFGWVSVGVGERDHFLAGCGWVWVSVTIFWLGVGGCG